jgi:hypothetical protein
MESNLDRESAKKSISARQSNDPEMEDVLDSASKFQLEIVKEQHRHLEVQKMSDLGFIGRAIGGEKNAPTVVALIAMMTGLLGAAVATYMAAKDPSASEFWGKYIERAVAFASASLTFIFGRGSKT